MKLNDLLAGQPPIRSFPDARVQIRKDLTASGRRLVVIDDDPTGVQTVHGVRVYFNWSASVLRKAVDSQDPVFFISTNSRSLHKAEVRSLSLEVGSNLKEAAGRAGAEIILASRSDSTLRGHFPFELEALTAGLGLKPDGVIIVPAFFEAGRYTVDDIHYAEQSGELVPVHRTEFARDPVFSFHTSDLKAWVVEKTGGQFAAEAVKSISLKMIRESGPAAVAASLMKASRGTPVIVNAAAYEDLEVVALGIIMAESRGKIFTYRCAASFIKARGGFEDKQLLTHQDLAAGGGAGLIIVGSYVEKTSRQLRQLLNSGLVEGVELKVAELIGEETRQVEIRSASGKINRRLALGATTVLYTSREVQTSPNQDFLAGGNIIMRSICEAVKDLEVCPSYVVAKGGITSLEVARRSLNAQEAYALGQIIAGVPVVRLGAESRWPDIPYVIFPGNVGDDTALLKVVKILQGV
jgi:uncharacterized protein YgbK (DUF1537 family)